MSVSARLLRPLLCAALLLGSASRSHASACPESEASFNGVTFFTTSAARFDSSTAIVGNVGARAAFDIPAGTVEVLHCCGLGVGSTSARDAFDVIGVPPGTPVALVAELYVEGEIISLGCGSSGCYGHLEGSITADQTTQSILLLEHIYDVTTVPVSGLVQLPVTIVAGAPRTIEFRMAAWKSAGGNHGGRGVGRIQFAGLPVGARVVSCKGFGDVVVPAIRATWGRIKTLYR